MSKVVDHLAELTGFRDRDVLDTTLAGALRDLLEPLRVAIHRCVGEDANGRRWLTRARLTADEAAATADPLWVEFDSLPRLTDFPARLAAIDSHEMVAVPGEPHVSVFPLFTDRDVAGVVADVGIRTKPDQTRTLSRTEYRSDHVFDVQADRLQHHSGLVLPLSRDDHDRTPGRPDSVNGGGRPRQQGVSVQADSAVIVPVLSGRQLRIETGGQRRDNVEQG